MLISLLYKSNSRNESKAFYLYIISLFIYGNFRLTQGRMFCIMIHLNNHAEQGIVDIVT